MPIFKLTLIINKKSWIKVIMADEFKARDESLDYDKDLATGKTAENNSKVRKRIDDLLEKKRLREALDDSDDWEI
jgi:hypothetical protein